MKNYIFGISLLIAGSLSGGVATASSINFDDQGLTGPSYFGDTTATVLNLVIDGIGVTISGGAVLDEVSNLGGNQTAMYGTASFLSGGLNPITIEFDAPVTNLFFDVFHGLNTEVSYTVSDDIGNSRTFALESNQSNSFETIGLATTGSMITILAGDAPGDTYFDFFIDNIFFNEALPGDLDDGDVGNGDISAVPLPAALPLYGAGLAVMGLVGWRKRRKADKV